MSNSVRDSIKSNPASTAFKIANCSNADRSGGGCDDDGMGFGHTATKCNRCTRSFNLSDVACHGGIPLDGARRREPNARAKLVLNLEQNAAHVRNTPNVCSPAGTCNNNKMSGRKRRAGEPIPAASPLSPVRRTFDPPEGGSGKDNVADGKRRRGMHDNLAVVSTRAQRHNDRVKAICIQTRPVDGIATVPYVPLALLFPIQPNRVSANVTKKPCSLGPLTAMLLQAAAEYLKTRVLAHITAAQQAVRREVPPGAHITSHDAVGLSILASCAAQTSLPQRPHFRARQNARSIFTVEDVHSAMPLIISGLPGTMRQAPYKFMLGDLAGQVPGHTPLHNTGIRVPSFSIP